MLTIYSTPMCEHCRILKSNLDNRKVKYESIDITKMDPQDQIELAQRAGRLSVPLIELDEKFITSRELEQVLTKQ